MKTWIKRAAQAPTEIGECPEESQWRVTDLVDHLQEALGSGKEPEFTLVERAFSSGVITRDISNLMVWANAGAERILRVIKKDVLSNPEEIARISRGLHYINERVKPVLTALLDSKFMHDVYFPRNPQIRALFYALCSTLVADSAIKEAAGIAARRVRKVKKEKIEEINIGQATQALVRAQYNISNMKEFTLVIIRELMQNAADACNKKQAETGEAGAVWIEIKEEALGGGHILDREGNAVPLCDIICRDSGVGMNWETVRKKFLVLLESGKTDDLNATGGFGAASGVIMAIPEHGWTLETNGLAASRGSKSAYFAAGNKSKGHPLGKFHPSMRSTGTSVTLMGMATVADWDIKDMMEKYTIGSDISFYFTGIRKQEGTVKIVPKFDIEKFAPLSDNIEDIAAVALKGSSEQIVNLARMDIARKGENFKDTGYVGGTKRWNFDGDKFVDIRLLVSPTERKPNSTLSNWYSPAYLLNNQFQFDGSSSKIANLHMIVAVTTNIRPLQPNYPVSTGRDSLISLFKRSVEETISRIQKTCNEIAENKVLLSGTITTILNPDLQGLSINTATGKSATLEALEEIESEGARERTPEEWIALLEKRALGNQGRDQAGAVIEMLRDRDKSRHLFAADIEEMFKITEFPVSICIEKDYLPSELVHANREAWLSSILLWSFTLKTLMTALEPFIKAQIGSTGAAQQLIPGIVISKECVGLYNPPVDKTNQLAQISINPLAICQMLFPEATEQAAQGLFNPETNLALVHSIRNEERISISLFHTGVHELTHFYFPDSYGGPVRFHSKISYLEAACHLEYPAIRNRVQEMSQHIIEDCYRMLKIINQDAKSERQGRISEVPSAG